MTQHAPDPRIETLFEPASWLTPQQVERILVNLTLTKSRLAEGDGEGNAALSARIVLATAERMAMQKNGGVTAAHLLACTQREVLQVPSVFQTALTTLRQFGTGPARMTLIEKFLPLDEQPSPTAVAILRFALKLGLFSELQPLATARSLLKQMSGDSVLKHLQAYEPDAAPDHGTAQKVDFLATIADGSQGDSEQIARNLNWGVYASGVLVLSVGSSARWDATQGCILLDPADPEIEVLRYCLEHSDLRAFRQDAKQRGAVVLQTHGMVRGLTRSVLRSVNLPVSLIDRKDRAAIHPNDFHIATTKPEIIAINLAKLIKLHRKGPRITRIFPDGPDSSDRVPITVLGKETQVSLGAASIAYFGKAPLYFVQASWDGQGFTLQMTPGPQLADCKDLDTARAEFLEFYTDCVTKQICGPTIDFGEGSGILWHLARKSQD